MGSAIELIRFVWAPQLYYDNISIVMLICSQFHVLFACSPLLHVHMPCKLHTGCAPLSIDRPFVLFSRKRRNIFPTNINCCRPSQFHMFAVLHYKSARNILVPKWSINRLLWARFVQSIYNWTKCDIHKRRESYIDLPIFCALRAPFTFFPFIPSVHCHVHVHILHVVGLFMHNAQCTCCTRPICFCVPARALCVQGGRVKNASVRL